MKQRLTILQSKLSWPRTGQTLPRGRLAGRLGAIASKRLALVVAGAGYGKTTLAAQTAKALGIPVVWYSLDETDRDFSIFLAYLTAGLARHRPGFGKGLQRRLAAAASGEKWRQALLVEFLEAFETKISDDVVVVLDDFHALGPGREVADAVAFLLARCPANLHWVMVSRTEPPLKLSRYRAMGEVIDLGEADLAFQRQEVEGLYRNLLQVETGRVDFQKVHERTGGWAVGLVLLFNALSGIDKAGADETLFEIGRSRKLLFQYLEENIFDHQPEPTRQFLMRSSLMDRIEPEFCNIALEMAGAGKILDTLCRNHLLTFPDDTAGHTCRYHHLFQDYLRDKLVRTHGTAEVGRIHGRIGAALEQAGDTYGALRHYLAGSRFHAVCRVFERMVFADFMDCPFRFLLDLFEKIPASIVDENPKMLYMAAKLASLGGDIAQSLAGFRAALSGFEAAGDAIGILTCQKELGMHYYLTGDMPRAIGQIERLWGQRHDDAFFPAEIAGYLILFSILVGDLAKADDYYRRARGFAGRSRAETGLVGAYLDFCYAYRFHTSGDFAKADRMNRNSLERLKRLGMALMLPLVYFQIALTRFFMGEPEDGSAQAGKGLALARELGIYNAQYAWLLYGDALNRMGRGDLDGADGAARESHAFFQEQRHGWGMAANHELRGMIRRQQGAWKDALGFFRKALGAIDNMVFPTVKASITVGIAETLADAGRNDQALAVLEKHAPGVETSRFLCFRKDLVLARIGWRGEGPEPGLARLAAALSRARENRYDFWVLRELPGIARPVLACHGAGKMAGYIETLFHRGGAGTEAAVHCLKQAAGPGAAPWLAGLCPEDPPPLQIGCLGPFSVAVGGRPIPPQAWKNSKAKKIFQYLAMRFGKGYVPKEMLLELAWPGEDGAKTNRRFHVAMTFLRKLLEPDLKRGTPSAYLLRRESGYRLDPGRAGRIDFIDFLAAADKARKMEMDEGKGAMGAYRRAEALYTGPLFFEEPYEDAFSEAREGLRERYLMVLRKLMRHGANQKNWDRCAAWAEKYLAEDPGAEPAYCALMRCCAAAGDTSGLKRAYHRCHRRLAQDLGLLPQKHTEALYRRLLSGKT